jgi:5-bromo-4-chloroindolyl phosphate hydrolysis protein
MTPAKAELIAGLTGAATFLLTYLVLAWPLGVGLLLAFLLYAGFNLLLGGVVEEKVQQILGTRTLLDQLEKQIQTDRAAIDNLLRLARAIEDEGIRGRVEGVCRIAGKIFDNFAEDPEDVKQAQRFVVQFQKLLPIVENYVHLSSDADRRAVLTAQDEANIKETLDAYTNNLKEAYQAYQENNLQKLRMATGVLKRMVDMDSISSRRGSD